MQAIEQRKIFVGMSVPAFECSWPRPWNGNFIFMRVRLLSAEVDGRIRRVYPYNQRVKYQELLPCDPPMAVFVEDDTVVGFLHGELPEDWRLYFDPAAWTLNSECAFYSHD
jgi:hypothetical protein